MESKYIEKKEERVVDAVVEEPSKPKATSEGFDKLAFKNNKFKFTKIKG